MGKLNEEHGKYPNHTRQDEDRKSWNWCLSNGIKIGPIPMWGDDYGLSLIHI